MLQTGRLVANCLGMNHERRAPRNTLKVDGLLVRGDFIGFRQAAAVVRRRRSKAVFRDGHRTVSSRRNGRGTFRVAAPPFWRTVFSRYAAVMISILPSSVGLLADYAATEFGSRVALRGSRDLRFDEIAIMVRRVAGALIARGLKPGQRVTLYGENSWHWVIGYHAVLRAGGVVNPANPLLTADELRHIIVDCEASLVISSCDRRGTVSQCGHVVPVIDYDEIAQIAAGHEECDGLCPATPLASICYTSGTTGRPKGAMLSHRAILYNVALTAMMHGKCASDHIVSSLPFAHVYGNVVFNSIFVSGASLQPMAKFDAAQVLDGIESGATVIEGVPTMYAYLLRENLEARDLSALRICTVGGQTMPVAAMEEVERRLGCPLIELWGMTELAGLGATQPWRGPRRLGSIGTALPFLEVRVDAAEGERGELLVRGPMRMDGYYNNLDATAEAITPDGWLRTGDVATRDEDGWLYVVDRAKDMILSAGYNIYPAEVERVIAEHEGINLVAVAGIPDSLKGETPVAWVVLKPGCELSETALLTYCRERLAPYKVPRRVVFVLDLPRTSTGKILRRALAETLEKTP